MKKTFVFMVMGLFLVSMIGMTSAVPVGPNTLIAGTIYNSDFSEKIGNANITVACANGGNIYYRYTVSTSGGDAKGDYQVTFPETNIGDGACKGGDSVTVTVLKDSLSGVETETVVDNAVLDIDIAIINVSMTPEFGFFLGIVTLLGSVGIIYVIRKE